MIRVIKLVYNDKTEFIKEIVDSFIDSAIIETYNKDTRKEKKKATSIQTNFGTKNVPLIVFEDENLVEIDAIWSENKPDWKKEINKKLNKW